MIKAIIFDKDGVLIDSEEFYLNRRLNYLKEKGIKPGSTNLNDFIGNDINKNWITMIPHDENLREELKKDYSNNYIPNNPLDYSKYTRKNLINVFEQLKSKNIKIAIASAASLNDIKKFIEATNIEKYLDLYISGMDCANNKPYPDVYLKAMESLELKKEEVLIVEDSVTGIKAAKSSGAKVIAYKPKNYHIDQSDADFKIEDLSEVLNFVN